MQRKTSGIVLIIIGILMVAYTGFNFVSTEKVVDLGVIQINQEKGTAQHILVIVFIRVYPRLSKVLTNPCYVNKKRAAEFRPPFSLH